MSRSTTHRNTSKNAVGTIVTYILTGASWVSVIALWCCAASAYVNPGHFRLAGVIGLTFPLFLCGTLFTGVLCLLFCPRRSWICAMGIVLAAGSIRSYCPWNPTFLKHPEEGDLKVLSYNCHSFSNCTDDEERLALLNYLHETKADILCFQEGNANFESCWNLLPGFAEEYPYHLFPYKEQTMVQGCYSRYPITRSEMVTQNTLNAVIAFWIELPPQSSTGGCDSLLVVNCHLQSNHLTPEDREKYQNIIEGDPAVGRPSFSQQYERRDSTMVLSRRIAGRIAASASDRAAMTDTLITFLDRHPDIPTIVCGDFNDTPISYSVQQLRRYGLNDSFRMAGNGRGISFYSNSISVRIDHQFCSDHFIPVEAHVDTRAYWSDHYPLIVNYKYKTSCSN